MRVHVVTAGLVTVDVPDPTDLPVIARAVASAVPAMDVRTVTVTADRDEPKGTETA